MPAVFAPAPLQKSRKLTVFKWVALILVFFCFAALAFMVSRWPFRREAVVKQLEEASFSNVTVGAFHGTYFPRPGCVLEHVAFQHNPKPGTPPLMTIESVRIEGSFAGLFRRHVSRVVAEGLHILIPPKGMGEAFETPQRPSVAIDSLVSDGAILEVASSQAGKGPLRFVFHEFTLSHIGGDGPASFKARLSNPEPPGEISATGEFGPWNADSVGKTPVAGKYLFQDADLGVFRGISGLLSSSGKFTGELDHIEVDGTTEVPLFAVTVSSHHVQLRTQFHAVVNGENGDTFLEQVTAIFGKTTMWTEGSVAGESGQAGKATSLELSVKDGRIQDLLLLFATSPRAPMSGLATFQARVSIPPGGRPFLRKVELQGDFGIDEGTFTKPDTQRDINHLSEGALGENRPKTAENEDDPQTVLSDLKGHIVLKDGTARFSNLSFRVPGAVAQMDGSYNLISERIDLHGTLKTHSEPSETTQGMKAFMLKVLDPFFKKKPAGYIMPIKITGTYLHPSFGLDLGDHDDKKSVKENARSSRILGVATR
jgi:AsmA-like C-terminal region